jgi:hypothetical protein
MPTASQDMRLERFIDLPLKFEAAVRDRADE